MRNLKYHEEKAIHITEMLVYPLAHKSCIHAAKVSGKWFVDILMPTIREQDAIFFLKFEGKPIKLVTDA